MGALDCGFSAFGLGCQALCWAARSGISSAWLRCSPPNNATRVRDRVSELVIFEGQALGRNDSCRDGPVSRFNQALDALGEILLVSIDRGDADTRRCTRLVSIYCHVFPHGLRTRHSLGA